MYKYLDLARELKKLWNMRVKVIPIVVGALGAVPINLEKRLEDMEIRGRIETIHTTALEIGKSTQKSPGDLRRLVIQTLLKYHKLTMEDLEIRGRIETTQTTVLLKSARILRRVPET